MVKWKRMKVYHYRHGGKKKWNHLFNISVVNKDEATFYYTSASKKKSKQFLECLMDTLKITKKDKEELIVNFIFNNIRD